MSNKDAIALKQLMSQLQYEFQNIDLLRQALTHRSAQTINNERLEYLGDAILSFVIADALYQRFPTQKEGNLSRLRSELVKGVTLAEIARELALGEVLILGPGELKSGGFRRDSILADAFEALIGAVYLDSDITTVQTMILNCYHQRLNALNASGVKKDPKTQLQEYLQSRQQPLPVYSVYALQAEDHNPLFEAHCQVAVLKEVVIATGTSHKKAEQQAAEQTLRLLLK